MDLSQIKQLAEISAPAKAILCGQHAVVYGKDGLAFAVDLKCRAKIYASKEGNYVPNSISLKIHILNQSKCLTFHSKVLSIIESIPKVLTKKQVDNFELNEVQISFEEFSQKVKQNFGVKDPIELTSLFKLVLFCQIFSINQENLQAYLKNTNFIIQTSSQIPIGKGLGSSASFNSVLAASLLVITEILPKQKILQDNQYKSIINYISKEFEKVEHGKPSGIDNFVSIYGGMVLFNKSSNPPFRIIDNLDVLSFLSQNLSIGFVDSGVEKNTKLAVSNVLQKYNLHLEGQPQYKNIIEEIGNFPSQILSLLAENSGKPISETQKKLRMFEILTLNHNYLKELGLSTPEIEEIVQKYTIKGLSVAKITGAGMGGVVLIVGEKQIIEQFQSTQTRDCISSKMNTTGLKINFF